jgi:hypothetical protein
MMVGDEGFEPPTLWTQTRCATQAALIAETYGGSCGVRDRDACLFRTALYL